MTLENERWKEAHEFSLFNCRNRLILFFSQALTRRNMEGSYEECIDRIEGSNIFFGSFIL